jgi:hypothetical protein
MAGLFMAYRRTVFAPRDDTYAEAFGVDPEKVLEAEKKAAADRAQRGITTCIQIPLAALLTTMLLLLQSSTLIQWLDCYSCLYRTQFDQVNLRSMHILRLLHLF